MFLRFSLVYVLNLRAASFNVADFPERHRTQGLLLVDVSVGGTSSLERQETNRASY
jgi:hypothetical protein